jgi:hypothetical protein
MSTVTTNAREEPWLWRLANRALILSAAGVGLLALVLALGAADPPRAGPLLWQDDFKAGLGRWTLAGETFVRMDTVAGALGMTFIGETEQAAWAVTPGTDGDFTLEVAGAASEGQAAYGLVFGWHDETHYSAVLVNGNGYAEAYTQAGPDRTTWLAWQQWPHILAGGDSNRVRVDLRQTLTGWAVVARVNDEVLAETTLAGGAGQVGVQARGAGPAQVVFSWARLWGR